MMTAPIVAAVKADDFERQHVVGHQLVTSNISTVTADGGGAVRCMTTLEVTAPAIAKAQRWQCRFPSLRR